MFLKGAFIETSRGLTQKFPAVRPSHVLLFVHLQNAVCTTFSSQCGENSFNIEKFSTIQRGNFFLLLIFVRLIVFFFIKQNL